METLLLPPHHWFKILAFTAHTHAELVFYLELATNYYTFETWLTGAYHRQLFPFLLLTIKACLLIKFQHFSPLLNSPTPDFLFNLAGSSHALAINSGPMPLLLWFQEFHQFPHFSKTESTL